MNSNGRWFAFWRLCLVGALVSIIGCGDDDDDSRDTDDENDDAPLVGCGSQSLSIEGSSCSLTLDACTDDKVYEIACADTTSVPYTCECSVDGSAVATFDSSDWCNLGSGSAMKDAALPECDWNIGN